jgi:hypothetical protein
VSPEDLDLIRSLYDAMNRRDLATLREFGNVNPGFEWQSSRESRT